ncbi:hypothetical protein KIW84_030359 [Lathyrus oleraceus]|uniref:Uncharacterized protein n=1 Tax=Pisum sativum TaxID=3888 RepID=A0A9D4XN51_PEA|nr:hypothetical protein KIW84_030359 [Pisum sativum]
MVFAKGDPGIAALYDRLLVSNDLWSFGELLRTKFEETLWELILRKKFVSKSFKIWDVSACSLPFQAAAAKEAPISVWDANGRRLFTFEGHEAPIYSICPHHKENIQFIFSTAIDEETKGNNSVTETENILVQNTVDALIQITYMNVAPSDTTSSVGDDGLTKEWPSNGKDLHQTATVILSMIYQKMTKGGILSSSSSSPTSSNTCSSLIKSGDDALQRPVLPAWEIMEALPFILEAILTACVHGKLSSRDLTTEMLTSKTSVKEILNDKSVDPAEEEFGDMPPGFEKNSQIIFPPYNSKFQPSRIVECNPKIIEYVAVALCRQKLHDEVLEKLKLSILDSTFKQQIHSSASENAMILSLDVHVLPEALVPDTEIKPNDLPSHNGFEHVHAAILAPFAC